MQLLERRALRADEAVAEHVVPVAADAHDLVAPQRDLEPAGRLAQRAGAERDAGRRLGHATSVPHPVTMLPRSVRHAPPVIPTHAIRSIVAESVRATRPEHPHDGRPWLSLCMIASADGATAVDGRSGTLGGPGDKCGVQRDPRLADVMLVGAGTVRAEHYGPPEARQTSGSRSSHARSTSTGQSRRSCAAARRSSSRPRPRATVPGERRSRSAPAQERRRPHRRPSRAARRAGWGSCCAKADRSLNGQLIEHGLVDELALTIAPSLVGGDSSRVAHGDRSALTGMSLVHVLEEDGSLFLRYGAQASGSR